MATAETDTRRTPGVDVGTRDARSSLQERAARLRASMAASPPAQALHPYEEVEREHDADPELVSALIEVDEERARLATEAVARGEFMIVPKAQTDDEREPRPGDPGFCWDPSGDMARAEAAIASGDWTEVARRERATYGRPRLVTVVRLAALRRRPVVAVRPRAREAAGRARRVRVVRGGRRGGATRGDPRDADPNERYAAGGGELEHALDAVIARRRPGLTAAACWLVLVARGEVAAA